MRGAIARNMNGLQSPVIRREEGFIYAEHGTPMDDRIRKLGKFLAHHEEFSFELETDHDVLIHIVSNSNLSKLTFKQEEYSETLYRNIGDERTGVYLGNQLIYMKKEKAATITFVCKENGPNNVPIQFKDICGSQKGFSVSFQGKIPDFQLRIGFAAVPKTLDINNKKNAMSPSKGFQFDPESKNFDFGGLDKLNNGLQNFKFQ